MTNINLRLPTITIFVLLCCVSLASNAQTNSIIITPIATDLNNPRGVAVVPDGRLLVVEAGTGETQQTETTGTGQLTWLTDANADGDFDDEGERAILLSDIPSYNSLAMFGTYHDEVFGLGDVVRLNTGEFFFTKDDPFAEFVRNRGDEVFYGDTGIFEMRADWFRPRRLIKRTATLNALAHDPVAARFYAVESGFNRLMAVDAAGEAEIVAEFPDLASGQQAVPAGIAVDQRTGEVLVALFSGFLKDYYGRTLSFMPGDSKVVRVDASTGRVTEVVTGLTTAIDVALDEQGNLYVVELTTVWPAPLMPLTFDLHDPTQPPDPGGYVRYSGRVSRFPANGGPQEILMDAVDTPTNLTYADGVLYVSTGLGTPGRRVFTPQGIRPIEGVLYRIAGL